MQACSACPVSHTERRSLRLSLGLRAALLLLTASYGQVSFANRKEEQAASVLSVLAEKQDFTQRSRSREEAGLDHGWGPGRLHPLQSW